MNILKTLSLLFLVFLTVACTNDPIIISGKIIDQTGLPIMQAEVSTQPHTDSVYTDKEGIFYLTRNLKSHTSQIQPGTYKVIVVKEGFETLEFQVLARKGNIWTQRKTLHPVYVEPVGPITGNDCNGCDFIGEAPMRH